MRPENERSRPRGNGTGTETLNHTSTAIVSPAADNTAHFDLATEFTTTDAERAFIGCLLHKPPFHVMLDCHDLRAGDFADARLQVVFETIKTLAKRGIAPAPAAVHSECQRTGTVQGAASRSALATLLADLFTAAPAVPQTSFYGRAVLELALRRRVTEAGTRIRQAADECSVADLLTMVATEHRAIADAAQRWHQEVGDTDVR